MKRFIFFLAAGAVALLAVNVYLCFRFQKLASDHNIKLSGRAAAAALSIGLVIFFSSILFQGIIYKYRPLTLVIRYLASFYIGMVIHSFLLFAAGDALAVLGGSLHFMPWLKEAISRIYSKGLYIPLLAAILTFYAFYNATDIKVTSYEINIEKHSSIPSLDAVMISDLHAGTSVGKKEMAKIKEKIEEIRPQILFICGDLFDHSSVYGDMMKFSADTLGSIKTEYGNYFVAGNHECYLGDIDLTLSNFADTGITVLRDGVISFPGFSVVGREDSNLRGRLPLSELLKNINRELPIILLDHDTDSVDEAAACGTDLQLSGHTHNGQLFPFNFVAARANRILYGLREEGSFKAIVSSGAGTWKYPIRTGSRSEIVRIKINFLVPDPLSEL